MEKNLQHSINYITQKTNGKSGFAIPKEYFSGIENDIVCKLNEEKTFKDPSFKLPKEYFTNLEDKILAKINQKEKVFEKQEAKVISLKKFIPFIATASVLLFVATYFFGTYNTTTPFDSITVAEIEDWYENDYDKINSNELSIIFEDVDFDNTEISLINFEEQDLEDYFNSLEIINLIN